MKKFYFAWTILLSFFGICNMQAAMPNLPAGSVVPQTSAAASPVWYNFLSSHLTAADRQNRFAYYNEAATAAPWLPTDQYATTIPDANQDDKYIWRLEAGATAGNVIFINKLSGKRIVMPSAAGASTNTDLTTEKTGTDVEEWTMKTSADAGNSSSGEATQYCFNAGTGNAGAATARFLNCKGSPATGGNYGLTVYNTGVQNASGWFFYTVTATKTVTFNTPDNGTLAVTGTNGTATPPALTSGDAVLIGTHVTVTPTPAAGYQLSSLVVNGVEQKTNLTGGSYKFVVNSADATINAAFSLLSGVSNTSTTKDVYPVRFKNTLNVAALAGTTIKLSDLSGKTVLTTKQPVINTANLAKGVYVVRFETAQGIRSVKVIKE